MPDILFETKNHQGIITLNRPQALNALNGEMFIQLRSQLLQWQSDDAIESVVIQSNSEKAFCAGGDIRAIYENKHKPVDDIVRYFELEYAINKMIAHYPKRIFAYVHGITMGGGVGMSVHASDCIAATNLRWAMPETLIGFFPDVGATYYLSRLPDFIGTYLALTGASIDAQTALELGLVKGIDDRDRSSSAALAVQVRNSSLASYSSRFFCFSTIEEIIDALRADSSDWAADTLKQLLQRSPTSLKVTLAQLHRAKNKTVDEVLDMDLHIARVMLQNHDFFEGVRAAIIDKDKNPQWQPKNIMDVTEDDVMSYFID